MKDVFTAEGLAVQTCRGHRYAGGYVRSLAMRNRWIEPMVAYGLTRLASLPKLQASTRNRRTMASPLCSKRSGSIFVAAPQAWGPTLPP